MKSVLIANRGEIAVRIIRTLRRLGLRSVCVFTDTDRDARHVRDADVAVRIDDYLDGAAIVSAAQRAGADAVHPGYGFLAENAAFARQVTEAGLTFIGPPASAIDLMGDKIRAKETVKAYGVPVVPGSSGSGLTDTQLADAAREVGLPVLLKPSAGGGGKGMRLVRAYDVLAEEIASARREALGSFGDDTLLVERWIDRPRHIEIQIMADTHGNVVHLGERECSLQRRHQKIIEEAPSVLLTPALRAEMGAAAVEAARSCGYVGAGTVEFIVPGDNPSEYFFMEMNTRLQVEHPVTELVTGLDLVELQLSVAAGAELPFTSVELTGHAVEARIYAEDPDRGFLPTGGTVLALHEPSGDGVRVDSSLLTGSVVGSSYDPMLAKVIAYGPDRATAINRLRTALENTRILGVTTNTGFLHRLLGNEDVVAGRIDTGLVERSIDELTDTGVPVEAVVAAALIEHQELAPTGEGWTDPFSIPTAWRVGGQAWTPYTFTDGITVRVRDGQVSVDGAPPVSASADGLRITYDGLTSAFASVRDGDDHWISRGADTWRLRIHDPLETAADAAQGSGVLTAPMPGTVTVVKVAAGDTVVKGQTVAAVEAMKMEHAVTAPFDGTVTEVLVTAGSTVALDAVLAIVEESE